MYERESFAGKKKAVRICGCLASSVVDATWMTPLRRHMDNMLQTHTHKTHLLLERMRYSFRKSWVSLVM